MSKESSGAYVIDPDYNIISCNQSAREMYPQLKKGVKCYTCLMNLDKPCETCPVANNIQGPQTYMDPIRKIYETVDAVEIELDDGRVGHALIMSTVGESEATSARLPRTHDELDRLLEQEFYDKLTDGYSRKGFIREVERVLEQSDDKEYAVVMFDLRNFKAINDTFGVEGGDEILRYIFDTLSSSWLKPVVSARIESGWFIFLVEAESLRSGDMDELLNLEWDKGNRDIHLHLRCGIYYVDDRQAPVSNMVEWAIIAKESTEQGEYVNCAVFNEAMRKNYIDHAEIASNFQNDIRNKDFKVYFQPVVRAEDGKLCSAEALVRWEHPKLGFVTPGAFIPALEKSGLISELDRYVLYRVYEFQESLQDKGLKSVPISVNLSRQDFYNDHLMSDIFDLAEHSPLPKGSVNYEVTETSVAALRQNCAYMLEQIQQVGARVYLDDFGSGYSSLSMIGDYPFDAIKIDKSFIDQVETNPTVRAVVSSTIDMCHKLELKTVAEGVETKQQLDFLKECKCDYIQGYFFSRPMNEDSFLDYLSSSQDEIEKSNWRPAQYKKREIDFENLVDLVDHSGMFIQVCHPEDHTMVFANELTRLVSGHPDEPYVGKKCYHYMLGLDAPCGHCPMNKMGDENEKTIEVDDGQHVFSLIGRYTYWNGRKVFIEYGRDVTNTKIAQRRYTNHLKSILEDLPEGQGVFHVDLTADKWLSSGGNAQNAQNIQDLDTVDDTVRAIAEFVPDEEGQEKFFKTFNRTAQLEAYSQDKHQIILETLSYFDDESIRWARVTAQLIENPNNGHIESVIYGVDISKEKTRVEELERERQRSQQEKEALEKEVEQAWDMYSQADRDRRFDYLTGLNSRLDLYDLIGKVEQGGAALAAAVMMLDIDGFKDVNDTYGHLVGDKCLKVLGNAILDFGTKNGVSFYRYGGEEIIGLVQDENRNIQTIASDLLKCVRTTKITLDDGTDISLTASIGYTMQPGDCQEMIDRADKAMYLAKKRGKDQFACID
ncbi:MAG: EAL domain-containing protein [Coriobacteriales bacterium]|jgi:diguanylate cyclase (GGDEF)-like protein